MAYRTYRKKRTSYRKKPSYRRKTYRKSSYRRSSSSRKTTFRGPRARNALIQDTAFIKHRLFDIIDCGGGSVPVTAGEYSVIKIYISGNDLTNAFGAFSADTPAGMLQYSGFYQNNIVHASSLLVTPVSIFQGAGGAVNNIQLPYQLTVVPFDTNGASSNVPFDEQPYAKSKIFHPIGSLGVGTSNSAQGYGNFMSSLYNTMMTKKILGVKDLADNTDYWSNVTGGYASPISQWYWGIEIKSLVPLTTAAAAAGGVALYPFTLGEFQIRLEEIFKTQYLNRVPVIDLEN